MQEDKVLPFPLRAGTGAELRDAFVLLRIPFSVYLMPIYLFSLSQMGIFDIGRAVQVFLILHLLLYPASNAYNSYYDRDEGSIGGLEKPPAVNRFVLYFSYLFEAAALLWGFLLAPAFGLFLLGYTLFSRAYSNDVVRLKRYPIFGFLMVIFFQGAFTYAAVWVGVGGTVDGGLYLPALISSLFLAGYYPLTQVYQHEEDAARGDHTLSLLLGHRGTFWFSGGAFALAAAGMAGLFILRGEAEMLLLFAAFTAPAMGYFGWWAHLVHRHPAHADFASAMRMNKLAAFGMSAFFLSLLTLRAITG
jgi:4-hydroxybenzoate polyprenyltransferase